MCDFMHKKLFFLRSHPFITIFCSLILFLLCASGVSQLYNEDDDLKMWLPLGTDFKRRSEYLDNVFEDEGRHNSIIIIAKEGNILTAQNLKAIYKLREGIAAIRTENEATWENRCDRAHRSEGNDEEAEDGSFTFPTDVFPEEVCKNIEQEEREKGNVLKFCKEKHLFEIWANQGLFDQSTKDAIESLTDADVLAAINADEVISGLTGSEFYPSTVLGTIKKENGNIVSAKAMSFGFEEMDTEEDESLEHDMTMDFEQALIDLVNEFEFDAPGLIAFPNARRSRNDISGSDSDSDLQLFFIGYALVGIYVQVMLGKFNRLETRYAVSICGIVAVGFGLISSYGVCSYIGWFSSNMNQIMPFLILGIGIDDMFVIAQNFDNLEASDLPLEKKMGVGLRHAGMAITITTLTDILAFAVGASTVLPALRYFCLYCAFAIFFVYVYMLTFFFALFVLDQRRVEAKRSAFFCCNKLPDDYQPNACSQKPLLPRFFRAYAGFLINKYVKIAIVVLTTILLGMSCYGVSQLEANFDHNMFVPEDNYLRDFIEHKDEYFPSGGMVGAIYIANLPDVHTKMHVVKKMRLELEKMDILADSSGKGGFDDEFEDYVDFTQPAANYPETALDKTTFYENVAEFLWTVGKPHQEFVRFDRELRCEKSTGDFDMLSVPYRHLG